MSWIDDPGDSIMLLAAIKAGAVYFALVFASGFVLGALRVLVIAPRLGPTAAVLAEAPVILAISWVACRWCLQRFALPRDIRPGALMGMTGFLLLMGAELALSVLVFGQTVAAHVGAYLSVPGAIGLAAQVAYAVFPTLQNATPRAGAGILHAR